MERKNSLLSKFCDFVSLKWNRFNGFVNFLIALCGAVTAIFSCYAAINSNEISKRSFINAEQSAQPIITSYLKNDTLNVVIEKDYRGLNFVEAKPMLTLSEGVVNDQELTSMKSATFLFQGSKKFTSCVVDDESNVIKCHEPDLNVFLNKVYEKIRELSKDSDEGMFRDLRTAYLLNVSYNDIYNKNQRQMFIVSQRGRQRMISDSLYRERFFNMERFTMADTTVESAKALMTKLEKTENKMKPREK